jgi:hypothetical protein
VAVAGQVEAAVVAQVVLEGDGVEVVVTDAGAGVVGVVGVATPYWA